jgi:Na+-driven multidrug efflux pump
VSARKAQSTAVSLLSAINPARELTRRVFLFGLPLILGLAAHAIFNIVDTFLVGQLPGAEGAAGIAVTGLCDPITTFQTILLNGPIAGAGVLIALRFGARDEEGMRKMALQATGFVLLLSLALGVPGVIFARELALMMGAREEAQQLEHCTQYLRVLLGGGFTGGMFLYLATLQRAVGSVKAFMALFLTSNVLNLVFCVMFIYGPGPYPDFVPAWWTGVAEALHLPRLGVVGSAWGAVAARVVSVALAVALARGYLRGPLSWLWPRGRALWDLVSIGFWKNGQVAVRGIAGGALIRTLQSSGGGDEAVVSGVFVGMKIELLLTLIAFGWGTASQTLVATSIGAGKPLRGRAEERACIVFALACSAAATAVLLVFARDLAAWFNPEPELVHWSERFLVITAASFVLTPLNVVISQTMFSRMHLRLPVLIDGGVLLLVMVPALAIAALAGAAVETLLWINTACSVALTGVYAIVRWKMRREAARVA